MSRIKWYTKLNSVIVYMLEKKNQASLYFDYRL
jgi:hypothetical protein